MPKVLEDCVTKLRQRGYNESSAYAICTSALQKAGKLKPAKKKSK